MEELPASNHPPEFHSLTAIMERFQTVPYAQFQQELQNWFEHHLAKQLGLAGPQELHASPSFLNLPDLISQIYHQAEVSNLLSNAKINTNEQGK